MSDTTHGIRITRSIIGLGHGGDEKGAQGEKKAGAERGELARRAGKARVHASRGRWTSPRRIPRFGSCRQPSQSGTVDFLFALLATPTPLLLHNPIVPVDCCLTSRHPHLVAQARGLCSSMAAAAPPQPRAEMPAPSRGADLEAAATGRPPPPQKRQLQATDREYEKCACCRRKHLKVRYVRPGFPATTTCSAQPPLNCRRPPRLTRMQCLPTNRDWSKGEKCLDCSKRNCPCGPNEKAPKIRKTLAVGGEVQFGLAPSPSSLSHTPTRPIRASSLVSEGGVGLPFSCTPSQASLDSAIEEETSIYSWFVYPSP